MGLRDKLNKNPAVAVVIAIVVVGGALVAVWQFMGGGGGAVSVSPNDRQAYYSNDDGKTFFKDLRTQIAPFTKDGKTTYECRIFQCAGGEPFVGYLVKYEPDAKKKIEAMIAAANPEDDPEAMREAAQMVKAPGTGDDPKKWVKISSNEGFALLKLKCPNGTGIPQSVVP